MNLFILSTNPTQCAEMMMDVHIVKIILEAIQMLSTAKRLLSVCGKSEKELKLLANGLDLPVYKVAHMNHPVCIWVRRSYANYIWTLDLVDAMHKEWLYRYNHPLDKYHKSYPVAQYLRSNPPSFSHQDITEFAVAMPDEYKVVKTKWWEEEEYDVVASYREYYKSPMKKALACWRKREIPTWFFE
jgi:hypothetical protein